MKQFCPAVLVPVLTSQAKLCMSGVRRVRCTDLMESWSWILTFPGKLVMTSKDLCSPPARTIVQGVS